MGLGDKWKKQAEESAERNAKKAADAKAEYDSLLARKAKMKSDPEYAFRVKKDKIGLDFDSYSDEQLSEKNNANINQLLTNPSTKVAMDIATIMAGTSTRDLYTALRAQVEQNWIIIRQNEQIVRELKKLNQK